MQDWIKGSWLDDGDSCNPWSNPAGYDECGSCSKSEILLMMEKDTMSMIDNDNRHIQMLDRRINNAINMAMNYGMTDSKACKQWVIDQILRCLMSGNTYEQFKNSNEWDEGREPAQRAFD